MLACETYMVHELKKPYQFQEMKRRLGLEKNKII